ncbi:hypothetical protein AB0M36_36040 [Actinoplanes sp. NPDC051346]|uniref:hypothetical protein n=1 Tax=Actinoplanes sp. NPDC051346 TaxID=3155048 RepID=UPI003425023E
MWLTSNKTRSDLTPLRQSRRASMVLLRLTMLAALLVAAAALAWSGPATCGRPLDVLSKHARPPDASHQALTSRGSSP